MRSSKTGGSVAHKNLAEIRVLYADTDAMGIVYHTNYIKWFEVGRTELFRDVGITRDRLAAFGLFMPVTRAYCHYYAPAKYDELLQVETELLYVKRVSMKFRSVIREQSEGKILVEGYTVHGCTDREGRVIRLPEEVAGDVRRLL